LEPADDNDFESREAQPPGAATVLPPTLVE
jgi:hypothetical protein